MDMELVRRECLRGAYRKLAPSVQPPVTCQQHSIEEYSDLLAEWHLKRQFSLEDPQTSGNSGHPAGCQKWQAWQHRGFCLSLAGRAKFCQAAKSFQRASRRIQLFHIHSPCSRHHGFDFNFGQLSSSARYSPAFLCCHSPVMNRINLPLVRGLFKRVTSVLRPLSKSTSPETSRPCNARGISLLYAKRGKPRKPISFRPFGEVVNAGCLRPPFPEDRVTRDSLYAPTRSTGVTWCTFHWRSLSQWFLGDPEMGQSLTGTD